MEREIKFRTWNPKHNYFEYWGFYIDDIDNKPYFKGTPSCGGFVSNQILENTDQFTGLHDKNGKEIYERDICKRIRTTGHYVYDPHFPRLDPDKEKLIDVVDIYEITLQPECRFGTELITDQKSDTLEIIGNIHDFPEMIKKNSPAVTPES